MVNQIPEYIKFFSIQIKTRYTFSEAEAKKLCFHPPVQAMATLHAVDFPLSGSPTAAGKGQEPANVCHCEVKQST